MPSCARQSHSGKSAANIIRLHYEDFYKSWAIIWQSNVANAGLTSNVWPREIIFIYLQTHSFIAKSRDSDKNTTDFSTLSNT